MKHFFIVVLAGIVLGPAQGLATDLTNIFSPINTPRPSAPW